MEEPKRKLKKVHGRSVSTLRRDFQQEQLLFLQSELLIYLEKIVGQPLQAADFRDSLYDGQVLCSFMQKISPGLIKKKVHKKLDPFFVRENLEQFANACRSLKFPETLIFLPDDLIADKNPRLVTSCLVYLAKLAEKLGLNKPIPDEELSFLAAVRAEVEEEKLSKKNDPTMDLVLEELEKVGQANCGQSPNVREDSLMTTTAAVGDSTPKDSGALTEAGKAPVLEQILTTEADVTKSGPESSASRSNGRVHADVDVQSKMKHLRMDTVNSDPLEGCSTVTIFATGNNESGVLGIGANEESAETSSLWMPVPISCLSGMRIRKVSSGSAHAIVLSEDGVVFSAGLGAHGRLGHGSEYSLSSFKAIQFFVDEKIRIVDVAAGAAHSVCLSSTGEVFAFGFNLYGQCGVGADLHGQDLLLPTCIDSFYIEDSGRDESDQRVTKVVCGFSHTLLLTEDGCVLSCGRNASGELGLCDFEDRSVPTLVSGLLGNRWHKVVDLSAGYSHSLALTDSGLILGCGATDQGQLGFSGSCHQFMFLPLESLSSYSVLRIVSGLFHNLAVCDDGTVVAFGRSARGRIGKTSNESPCVSHRFECSVKSAACGYYHSLVCLENGSVYAWGSGSCGQLGAEIAADSDLALDKHRHFIADPQKVVAPTAAGRQFLNVSAGEDFSFFIC
eukprot:ANDGO_03903.mRNA.1 Ultraviolet-B receptor UVR8